VGQVLASPDGAGAVQRGKAAAAHYEKRLTARFVKTAGPGRHTDGGGLFLLVDPSGARRWLLRVVIIGRRRDLGLGSATLVSLADAREKAQAFRRIARAGGDPTAQDRDGLPPSILFRDAAEKIHTNRIKTKSRNGKHTDQLLTTLKTYAYPMIGAKRVYDITSADILTVLEPIWITKQETARRVLQRLTVIFDWALVRNYRVAANPVGTVRAALPTQEREVKHFAAIKWNDANPFMAELMGRSGVAALARLDGLRLRRELAQPGDRPVELRRGESAAASGQDEGPDHRFEIAPDRGRSGRLGETPGRADAEGDRSRHGRSLRGARRPSPG
jgi:hypothetical protein